MSARASGADVDLRLIETGDAVTLLDRWRNRATGTAQKSRDRSGGWHVAVEVFGVAVEVARTNRAGTLVGNPEARVVGHQPPLPLDVLSLG